jgi:hypothetical protein
MYTLTNTNGKLISAIHGKMVVGMPKFLNFEKSAFVA